MRSECAVTRDTEVASSPGGCPQPLAPPGEAPGSAGLSPETTLVPGQTLGSYRILGKIGRGGMGRVYLAEHELLKRRVALKVLNTRWANDAEATIRFEREAVAAAQLDHPHIVRVHDAQRQDGVAFLVMEYVPGVDLGQYVRKHGPLPWNLAVECVKQVAAALSYAHACGVVHRDIKPQNLLYTSEGVTEPDGHGRVKVLDLGLAKLAQQADSESVRVTQDDSFIGTVGYMAPEQAVDPHHADARSDVYSLGCTLYVLLTGEAVFGGTTPERIRAHLFAPVPSLFEALCCRLSPSTLSAWRPHLEQLDELLQAMLAKHPEDRVQSMSEVLVRLSRIGGPGTVPPAEPEFTAITRDEPEPIAPERPWTRRRHIERRASFLPQVFALCKRIRNVLTRAPAIPPCEPLRESSMSRFTETLLLPHGFAQ
jgi:serine/threonine protein kinase